MVWMLLALLSSASLGIYDIFKKISLNKNAVIPVLFFSSLTNAIFFLPIIIISNIHDFPSSSLLNFNSVDTSGHLLFALKSVIVGSSWTLAYFSMKHLPITIVSPIRSSGPLWTLFGAIIIFGERMTFWQWFGLVLTIIFYYLFSMVGLKEGISFRSNKWVIYMTLSTIIGSISSLYDKYLVAHYNRLAMQAWYHVYMVPIMAIMLLLIWYPNRKKYDPFYWRWTIPMIGVCLTVGDFLYFWSLAYPGALIAIVSTIRRGSVIFSFSIGAVLFKEKNLKLKAIVLGGILLGIFIILLSNI